MMVDFREPKWDWPAARERKLLAELKEARRLVTILSVLSGVATLALLFMYLYMMYNGGN